MLRSLFEDEALELRYVHASSANGAYVDDRRTGERERIAEMDAAPLSRHEVDELYGTTLVEALEANLTVLGGPGEREDLLPADFYRRLSADLVANGRVVVVDLSGAPLRAAVAGGATIVKVSHEALVNDGYARRTIPCQRWWPGWGSSARTASKPSSAHERRNPRSHGSTSE